VLSKGVAITRRDAEPGRNSAGGAHVARELDRCPLSSRHGRSAGALPLGEEEPARRRCPRRVLVPLRRSGLIEQGVSDLFARAPRAPVASGSKTGRPPPWSRGSRRHAKKTIDRRSLSQPRLALRTAGPASSHPENTMPRRSSSSAVVAAIGEGVHPVRSGPPDGRLRAGPGVLALVSLMALACRRGGGPAYAPCGSRGWR